MIRRPAALMAIVLFGSACVEPAAQDEASATTGPPDVSAQIEAAVRAFHAADTARNAEAVIGLLWPDFTMLVDGVRQDYTEIAAASRQFMPGVEVCHTEWTDLRIIPLGPDAAVATLLFRDSIVTRAGEVIRSRGPTTFVWERRVGEWRLRFADADHYPINQ